jgi:protein ImuB
MTLEARETSDALVSQHGFLAEDSTLALEQLNDRVLNRHEAQFLALEEVESHIPERAEQAKPAARLPPASAATPARPRTPARPLLIFEAPEPAKVVAAVPDGPPMRITWRRVTRRVVKVQGPERVAPEWWRLAPGERPRDYYVVEDEQGRRFWLYREGLYGEPGEDQPRWFVHGLSA